MSKTAIKIIVYGLIVLVLLGVVGIIYKFTNGFNEDFKTFYVEYNGEKILTENTSIELAHSTAHKFNVKYTFAGSKEKPKEYSVKIVPHAVSDFEFTVAEKGYVYSKVGDLTKAFNLEKKDTSFELTIPEDMSIQTALEVVYGEAVSIPDDAEESNFNPFRLVISSYNEKVNYFIDFKVVSGKVTGITLEPDRIEFWED